MSDLLREAIADADRVKELAYENARQAISEAFQPKLQRMITAKLAEEDDDDLEVPMDDPAMDPMAVADPAAEPVAEPVAAPVAPAAPAAPVAPVEVPMEDPAMAAADPTMPAEEDEDLEMSEEYQALMREFNMSDDEMETEMDPELEMESILPDNVVLEIEDDMFETAAKPKTDSIGSLRTEVARLRKENDDARRAIVTLKSAMNEVNLLNAKLMYASKAAQSFELTESQQVKLLKTFDRARTIREVKLVYTALCENYQKKSNGSVRNKVVTEAAKPAGGASRTVNVVGASKQLSNKGELPFASRWKELANIGKS
jgi:hypothetical protein